MSRSTAQQGEFLRSIGCEVRTVSPRQSPLARWPIRRGRRGVDADLAIYNLSSWRTMLLAAPAVRGGRGYSVGYLHGGTLGRWLDQGRRGLTPSIQGLLRRFDEVWVTNERIGDVLAARFGVTALTVSPHVADGPPAPAPQPSSARRLVTAAYNAAPLYRLQDSIAAANELGKGGDDVHLDVLLYGHDRPRIDRTVAEVEERCVVPLTVHRDLAPDEVTALLSPGSVLLRLTETDGDSLLVREALGRGARVVATDTVPRPSGVELTAPDAVSVADAVRRGGVPATGEGLGLSCGVHLGRLVADLGTPRSGSA